MKGGALSRVLALGTAGLLAAGLGGCGGAPCTKAPEPPPDSLATAQTLHLPAGSLRVDVCETRLHDERIESVRVYVDVSGSMAGFAATGSAAQVARWALQSASALPAYGLMAQRQEAFVFSQAEGVRAIAIDSIGSVGTKGDTNLPMVLQKAASDDLAVVLTDGVPFSREEGTDCRSGAGSGCMLGALAEAIQGRSESALILVPVVAPFDGPVYLEGQTAPPGLTAQAITDNVRKTFPSPDLRPPRVRLPQGGFAPRAGRPDVSRPPTAPGFAYTGPRPFILMILARDLTLARTYVRALSEQRGLAQVAWLGEEAANYRGGLAALTPLELVPGLAPVYTDITAATVATSGAIETEASVRGTDVEILLACDPKAEAWAALKMSLSAPRQRRCDNLISLSAVEVQAAVAPTAPGAAGDLESPLRLGLKPSPGGSLEADLLLQCPCGGAAAFDTHTNVTAQTSRQRTLADLRTGTGPLGAYLGSISSVSAAEEPHKSLGLSSLVLGVANLLSEGKQLPVAVVRVRNWSGK
jgi:hypothetical protein